MGFKKWIGLTVLAGLLVSATGCVHTGRYYGNRYPYHDRDRYYDRDGHHDRDSDGYRH